MAYEDRQEPRGKNSAFSNILVNLAEDILRIWKFLSENTNGTKAYGKGSIAFSAFRKKKYVFTGGYYST